MARRLRDEGLWNQFVRAQLRVSLEKEGTTALPRDPVFWLIDAERAEPPREPPQDGSRMLLWDEEGHQQEQSSNDD